jgi:hypothetical protein
LPYQFDFFPLLLLRNDLNLVFLMILQFFHFLFV